MVWKGEVAIQRHYLCLYHLRRGTKQHCLNRVLVNRESISLKCEGQSGLNFFGRRVCQHSFCFQIDTQPIHQQLILKQLLCLKPLSSPQSVVGRLFWLVLLLFHRSPPTQSLYISSQKLSTTQRYPRMQNEYFSLKLNLKEWLPLVCIVFCFQNQKIHTQKPA